MASSSTAESRRLASFGSVLLLVILWWLAARLAADARMLPGPALVLARILEEAASGALPFHLAATLARVAAAFVLAMAIGAAIGMAMGASRRVDAWGDPWLIGLLNLPALVTMVLCYIWIGLNEAAAVAAVAINKIPLVAVMLREGARTLDPQLEDMAQVFRFGRWKRFRHVVLPQLAPHLAAAGRAGIALIWKIVLVVEFLGRSNGVGFQIHLYFQLFDVASVLAYAISFIAIMLAVEALLLRPWEARATRWRRT